MAILRIKCPKCERINEMNITGDIDRVKYIICGSCSGRKRNQNIPISSRKPSTKKEKRGKPPETSRSRGGRKGDRPSRNRSSGRR